MKIVTLTTDWGNDGFYAASVKGKLLSLMPDVQVVDISHNVKKFDVLDAYFKLKNSFHYFPKGSVHIVGVNSIESSKRHIFLWDTKITTLFVPITPLWHMLLAMINQIL